MGKNPHYPQPLCWQKGTDSAMKKGRAEPLLATVSGPATTDEGTIVMGHTPDIRDSDSVQDLPHKWHAYQALCRAEKRDPSLIDNPVWKALRQEACNAFISAFDAVNA